MIGFIITSFLITLCVVRLYKNAYKRPLDTFPPGPISLPVYGAYWIVLMREINNLGGSLRKLARYYDTKVLGMYLGKFPTIVVDDPKLIKETLNNEDFDGRLDIIISRLRSFWKRLGIFFTDGYFWHVQRRFTLRYMRDFGFGRRDETLETVIANETKEMVDLALNGPKYPEEKELVKGDLIFLQHFFAVPFINGILHIFTRSTIPRSEYHVLWDLARKTLLFQRGTNDLGGAITLTPWLKDVMPNYSGYTNLCKGNQNLLDFFSKLIKQTYVTQDDSHDRHFLDCYIRKMKEEQKSGRRTTFSDEQLQLVCTDYMFPAATGIQSVLTFLIERILLQPEIQDKIHEEIDRVVGRDRLPTLDDRQNMPYLEACLREIMRFETLVPLGVPHRTMKDCKLEGYDIPENTVVVFNYVTLHFDKDIWGDPENFRPERFITNGVLDLSKDKSLPFGAGKRLCAGETYARQSMFQVFAGFMQAFSVSTADGKPLTKPARRIQGIITTVPEFWVRVTPRVYEINKK
ncbi:probable cytochrome P450 304a1 [Vanessa atalanta]|uniref:probable cytochrome P450 304a1 n=1 Tax=Vanessa atalanta TaxID=42275 RepID=UPI001FCCF1E9|nr:probable cytochrome P450 304a1 [Vanessa atalanta]